MKTIDAIKTAPAAAASSGLLKIIFAVGLDNMNQELLEGLLMHLQYQNQLLQEQGSRLLRVETRLCKLMETIGVNPASDGPALKPWMEKALKGQAPLERY